MKCQYCEKPATFHITELTGDKPSELHFCEEHARIYLTQSSHEQQEPASSLAGVLAQHLKVGQTAEDLAQLDQRACPVCGVTFYEFRHAGRLGCPHDYVCFHDELMPLIVNIHGANEHVGKRPRHGAREAGEDRTILFGLSGHGNFDLAAYQAYLGGELTDYVHPQEAIDEALAHLPEVDSIPAD